MEILDLIKEITTMMDLEMNETIFVSKRIFKALNKLHIIYNQLTQKLIKLTSTLEKAQKNQLEYIKTKCEFDLSNKEEVSIYTKGNKVINELNKRIRLCEHDIKIVENTIKMVMKMDNVIRNINDYERFKNGVR